MPVYQEEARPPAGPLLDNYTILAAVVTKIEERETPFKDDDGNPQRQVNFTFKVSGGSDDQVPEDRFFYGSTPTFWNNSDKCKLRQWAQSIANRIYAPGEPLDTDQLVNRPCKIVIGQKKKQNGDMVNRVIDVTPDRNAAPVPGGPSYNEPF